MANPIRRLEGVGDLAAFFRVLPDLLSADSVLVLEDTCAKDVANHLAHRADRNPPWPRGTGRHRLAAALVNPRAGLPVCRESMATLSELAETHAEPGIAIHLTAYGGEGLLLAWYDLPGGPIWCSGHLSPDEIQRAAGALGARVIEGEAGV